MASALVVAKYLLSLQDENAGDTISNLKLQKLLYYAQGYHLAIFDCQLFSEKVRRWAHGPVVREIYDEYRQYGSGSIPPPVEEDFSMFDDEQKEFLQEVYRVFGQYSAWKLRNMTHAEPPWREATPNSVISRKTMREYFSGLVGDQD